MSSPRASVPALLLIVASLAQAADIRLDTHRRGDAIEISASAVIAADPDKAWAILTDYDRYPGFIPDLTSSRVVERDGSRLVIEQQGEVHFLWIRIPLAVRMAVVETPIRDVHSILISGTVQELEGHYELEPTALGVRLTYIGRIVPDAADRSVLDHFAIRTSVSRQFGALVGEIEQRGR